jgi:hypothetical protein
VQTPQASQHLMRHIRALSVEIGARPATSPAEAQAAAYVESELNRLQIETQRQPFATNARLSQKAVPAFLLCAAALLIGLRRGRFWQIAGGLIAIVGGLNMPSVWRLRPMFWEYGMPRRDSQNVIGKLSPAGKRHKKIVVMAHLDTSYHRQSAHPALVGLFPILADGTAITPILTGLLSVAGLFRPLRWLGMLGMFGGAGAVIADELSGGSSGANDNASGVAVALGIAEALRENPLEETEVWFVFTGSEQSGVGGTQALLEKHGSTLSDALFINLKMVGAGEVAWATQQGLGLFGRYEPRYGLLPIAERAAAAHPELGVMGKPMLFIDDLTAIVDWGFSGITITAYDRLTGQPPNLHRNTDRFEAIDPQTLERASAFVLEMIRQLDSSEAAS